MAFSRITENAAMFWKTRALYQIIKIIAVGVLAITLKSGLSYIYGSLFAGIAFFLIYIKLLYINGAPEKLRVNIDSNVFLLLGFGVPLIFHAMSGNILTYADRFFVQGFLNSNQLGIYTFVYSLGSSIFFFYGTVASYFEPLTYRYHNNKFIYQTVLKFYLVFVLIFAAVMAVLIKGLFEPVILKFVSHDYSKGADCLTFILAGYLMIPFYTIANYELAVLSKTKFIAISTLLAAVFNVTVNYFIIQRLGIVGAAISTFATYCFLAVIVNLYARSKAGLDLSYLGYIVTMFLFVLCLLTAILYFKTNIIICSIVYVVILCILSYFLFIEYRKLRKQISW
jgi:O-antigen/teichoic acid export membrane protein